MFPEWRILGAYYTPLVNDKVVPAGPSSCHTMNDTELITELQTQLEAQRRKLEELEAKVSALTAELAEAGQRLDVRNLSLERLQAQFTIAAETVNKLLAEREKVRRSRWGKVGMVIGLLPKLEDDIR
jgi:Tfp pilus assembly protein FimV